MSYYDNNDTTQSTDNQEQEIKDSNGDDNGSSSHNLDSDNKEQNNLDSNNNLELEKCQKELAHTKERYYYLIAEFDNYKKRSEKEKTQWIAQAQIKVLHDILPVIDNFERALREQKSEEHNTSHKSLKQHLEGFEIIFKSLQKILSDYRITEINITGEFNPEEHEAVMQVQSDKHPSGTIVEVLEKGYKVKEHIIRPAKVSVAQ